VPVARPRVPRRGRTVAWLIGLAVLAVIGANVLTSIVQSAREVVAKDDQEKRDIRDSGGNPAHASLLQLGPSARLRALKVAIGSECSRATDAFFQGLTRDDEAFWNVRCDDDEAYSVRISPDAGGSTKVVDCAVMARLAVKCFERFAH
jgi:hypothetical protein